MNDTLLYVIVNRSKNQTKPKQTKKTRKNKNVPRSFLCGFVPDNQTDCAACPKNIHVNHNGAYTEKKTDKNQAQSHHLQH